MNRIALNNPVREDNDAAPRRGGLARDAVVGRPGEPASRRRRRASPDKENLLREAFRLFVELGFDGTTIDAIAASAGVAKRTLYQRYGDKEGLFRAAFEQAIDGWIIPADQLRQTETEDFEQTLLRIARLQLDNVLSPAGLSLMRLTNSVGGRMPELGAHNVAKGFSPTLSYLTELFAQRVGQRPRWFANPEDAALAFMNMLVTGPATLRTQGVALEDAFVERYAVACVSVFLHGLLGRDCPAMDGAGDGDGDSDEDSDRLKVLLAEALLEARTVQALRKENLELKHLVAELTLEKSRVASTLR